MFQDCLFFILKHQAGRKQNFHQVLQHNYMTIWWSPSLIVIMKKWQLRMEQSLINQWNTLICHTTAQEINSISKEYVGTVSFNAEISTSPIFEELLLLFFLIIFRCFFSLNIWASRYEKLKNVHPPLKTQAKWLEDTSAATFHNP